MGAKILLQYCQQICTIMLFLLLGTVVGQGRMKLNELKLNPAYQLTMPMQLSAALGVPWVQLLKGTIKQMRCLLSHGFKGEN